MNKLPDMSEHDRTGVFWLFKPTREFEVLVDGVVRYDYAEIISVKTGDKGILMYGLSHEQLCNVQIREVFVPANERKQWHEERKKLRGRFA